MERTRFFRRPVVWIILVIIGAIALSSFFASGPSYTQADTSFVLKQLRDGNATKALLRYMASEDGQKIHATTAANTG